MIDYTNEYIILPWDDSGQFLTVIEVAVTKYNTI